MRNAKLISEDLDMLPVLETIYESLPAHGANENVDEKRKLICISSSVSFLL